MQRPPRDPKAPLFGGGLVGLSLLQGASVLAGPARAVRARRFGAASGELEARALTFTDAGRGQPGAHRRQPLVDAPGVAVAARPEPRAVVGDGGAVAFLALVLYVPALRQLFRLAYLHLDDVGLCLALGLGGAAGFEIVKVARGRGRG